MQLKKVIYRSAALVATAFVALSGGIVYDDLAQGAKYPQSLAIAIHSIPSHLTLGFRSIAHGDQGDSSLPNTMFAETLVTVQSDYFGSSKPTRDLAYVAIRGMMGSLGDRYTRFMDPTEYSKMQEDTQGEFVGIGAVLEQNAKGQIYVFRPLPNSPAIKAHIVSGDIILQVNHKSLVGMDINDAVKLIRGPENTKVLLTLLHKGASKPIDLSITRNKVLQEVVVSTMLDQQHKIGYISLAQFNEESDGQINSALRRLHAQGMRALVFDLRGNPGGLLTVARSVASRFVSRGPIVWVQERHMKMQDLVVEPKQHNFPKYPLAVLVNGGSASASEITSGAIKDTHSGTLIGEKTFGKGLVQTIIPLPDQSAVAITTAHYFTPAKNDINHKGISPDVQVTLSDQDLRQMNSFNNAHHEALVDLKYDKQLQKAIGVLVAKLASGAHPVSWSKE
jgi:carboxyl-terminal processing protease